MNPEIIGNRIKSILVLENIKRAYLAKKLNMSYNTLTKKLNGKREFSVIEITKLVELLNLDLETSANLLFNKDKFIYKDVINK